MMSIFWSLGTLAARAWEFLSEIFLCTRLGGLCPSACFPVTIDVGTNNQKLLDDEVYIGFRHKRATGQEYADLLYWQS